MVYFKSKRNITVVPKTANSNREETDHPVILMEGLNDDIQYRVLQSLTLKLDNKTK